MFRLKCCSEFKEAFQLFDKNHDNRICANELRSVMNTLGQFPSQADVAELINKYDVDGP